MSDILSARAFSVPHGALVPVLPLLCSTQAATLRRHLIDDLNRDRALCLRLDRAEEPTDHIRRRIAATRASLADMEAN